MRESTHSSQGSRNEWGCLWFRVCVCVLPVALLVEAPPSSWGLHASICLCRCSASVECTVFPWLPSPKLPPRTSPTASGVTMPSRDLPPWPTSAPLLGLLSGSVRGGTSNRLEERWEDTSSSSSGIGLYQISPSSSASFSSAGSTFRGYGDTLVWPTQTYMKEKVQFNSKETFT